MSVEIVKGFETVLVRLLDTRDSMVKNEIRENPEVGLIALGDLNRSQDLSVAIQNRILDEILSLIPDPEEARVLMEKHPLPEVLAGIVAEGGSKFSVAVQIIDIHTLLSALQYGVDQGSQVGLRACFLIRSWADNMMERPNWEEELDLLIGSYSLRTWLIASVFEEMSRELEDITSDQWTQVGLDPDDAMEELARLIRTDGLPEFDELSMAQAMEDLRSRREAFEQNTSPAAIAMAISEMDV